MSNDAVSVARYAEENKRLREELSAYKNAEEQGLLIWLPCKIGDAVYQIKRCTTKEAFSHGIPLDRHTTGRYNRGYIMHYNRPWKIVERPMVKSLYLQIGKTVFLNREEAEKALEAIG